MQKRVQGCRFLLPLRASITRVLVLPHIKVAHSVAPFMFTLTNQIIHERQVVTLYSYFIHTYEEYRRGMLSRLQLMP